jgi:hypothetical protein
LKNRKRSRLGRACSSSYELIEYKIPPPWDEFDLRLRRGMRFTHRFVGAFILTLRAVTAATSNNSLATPGFSRSAASIRRLSLLAVADPIFPICP